MSLQSVYSSNITDIGYNRSYKVEKEKKEREKQCTARLPNVVHRWTLNGKAEHVARFTSNTATCVIALNLQLATRNSLLATRNSLLQLATSNFQFIHRVLVDHRPN